MFAEQAPELEKTPDGQKITKLRYMRYLAEPLSKVRLLHLPGWEAQK
jgi:hypothetical protein